MTISFPKFVFYAQVPLISVLAILLWILIILRIWALRRSDFDFPSHWRTASAACLIACGILSLAHLGLWARALALNLRIDHILPTDDNDDAAWEKSRFTEAQIDTLVSASNWTPKGIWTARVLLTVALWMAKLSFLAAFLATADYLPSFRRRFLYTVSAIVFLTLGLAIFTATFQINYDPFIPFSIDDILEQRIDGTWYEVNEERWELSVTALNLFSDLLMFGVALYIVECTDTSRRSRWLLMVMLTVAAMTSIARLVVAYFFLHPETQLDYLAGNRTDLTAAMIILSEAEVLVGGFLSCLPGLRAWVRYRQQVPAHQQDGRSKDELVSERKSQLSGEEKEAQKVEVFNQPSGIDTRN